MDDYVKINSSTLFEHMQHQEINRSTNCCSYIFSQKLCDTPCNSSCQFEFEPYVENILKAMHNEFNNVNVINNKKDVNKFFHDLSRKR